MIRAVAKWYISRSLDQNVAPPRWVRRWIDRDDELRQFESLTRQLGARLRQDALAWNVVQSATDEEEVDSSRETAGISPNRSRSVRRRTWSLAAVAMAASVIVALISWPTTDNQKGQSGHPGNQVLSNDPQANATVEFSRQWLIATWKMGRTSIEQLGANSDNFFRRVEFSEILRPPLLREPADIRDSITDSMTATLDKVRSERKQLASDLKLAVSYFTRRLPASTAKLVGLSAKS